MEAAEAAATVVEAAEAAATVVEAAEAAATVVVAAATVAATAAAMTVAVVRTTAKSPVDFLEKTRKETSGSFLCPDHPIFPGKFSCRGAEALTDKKTNASIQGAPLGRAVILYGQVRFPISASIWRCISIAFCFSVQESSVFFRDGKA
jgi:hypothetical protein